MAATAQLRSATAVLNWYADQPQAAFKLYRFSVMPKNITGAYDGKSKEEGYEKLQSELALIANDDYNNFVLGLFSEKDKEKSIPAINKVFTVNDAPLGMIAGYGVSNYQAQVNNEILNEIRALRAERLADAEKAQEPDDDEVEMTPSTILAGMLQQPRVQDLLINALSGLVNNFTRSKVQAVSGTHTNEDIANILQTLYSKGVTPEDLAKLAAMSQSQINMLLSMLRK
jgi:transcription initiation factor IIE alpha subunit